MLHLYRGPELFQERLRIGRCLFKIKSSWLIGVVGLTLFPIPRIAAQQISDFVVVGEPGRERVFVADEESDTVLVKALEGSGRTQLGLGDFSTFFELPPSSEPVSLSAYRDSLLIFSKSAAGFFSLNMDTKQLDGEPGFGQIRGVVTLPNERVRLASSENGRIALMRPSQGDVVWFDKWDPFEVPKKTRTNRDMKALDFDGQALFVLGSTVSGIYEYADFGLETATIGRWRSDGGWLGESIEDMVVEEGVTYAVDGEALMVRSTYGSGKLWKLAIPGFEEGGRIDRVRVHNDGVFVSQNGGSSIVGFDRPAPVTVDLDGGYEKSLKALAGLYEYLEQQHLLATTPVLLQRSYQSWDELLVDQEILLAEVVSPPEGEVRSEVTKRLTSLVCRLNSGLCNQGDQASMPLPDSIQPGVAINLPDIQMREYLSSDLVRPGEKNLGELIAERIVPAHQSQASAQNILEMNPSFGRRLEGVLFGLGLTVATPPSPDFAPGSLFSVNRHGENIGELISFRCRSALDSLEPEIAELPSFVSSFGDERLLPVKTGPKNRHLRFFLNKVASVAARSHEERANAKLDDLGASRIEVEFIEPVIEAVDLSPLFESPLNADLESCVRKDVYLTVKALKVKGARYRVFDDDGALLVFDKKDFRTLLGSADPSGEWSLIIDEEFYVGYEAIDLWNRGQGADSEDDSGNEPGGKKQPKDLADLLSLKYGSFRIPETRWTAEILLPARQFHQLGGTIAELANDFGVVVSRDLPVSVRAQSSRADSGAQPRTDEMTHAGAVGDVVEFEEAVSAQRDELFQAINYSARSATSTTGVKIGIGEDHDSIDELHPDFRRGEETVWLERRATGAIVKVKASVAGNPPPRSFYESFQAGHHGNHVAGVLAGSEGSLAPGLVPDSGLVLVNTPKQVVAKSLSDQFENAVLAGVEVFNLSLAFEDKGTFRRKIRNSICGGASNWENKLFIVAAGNEGMPVADADDNAPIQWARDCPNIIGVGALGENGNLLGDWKANPDDVHYQRGSNYGPDYVDLLAPGQGIWSLGKANSYMPATGSSQAAPFVTGVAAMLIAKGVENPSQIRARLLSTADWLAQFENQARGGRLNADRALLNPRKNFVDLTFGKNRRELVLDTGGESQPIEVVEGKPLTKRDQPLPEKIASSSILRLDDRGKEGFLVVYLDDDSRLKFIRFATLRGSFPCVELRAAQEAEPSELCKDRLLDISTISQFVSKVPRGDIKF